MQFLTGFCWDANERSRAWSREFTARMGDRMPTMSRAGVYSVTRHHHLQAVKDAGTDDVTRVVANMRATPIDDALAQGGHLRQDGTMIRAMMLVRVKAPAQSKGRWDCYDVLRTVPGDEAFPPPSQVACPLLKH